MVIAGLVKSSLIDYPGKVSAVVFTQGCNFHCGFCHNPALVPRAEVSNSKTQLSTEEVLKFLEGRVGKLDGVVLSGGEPTLQPDLLEFIKKLKVMGYAVKLDTNGSNPASIRSLITSHLIDYVAMDIKNSPEEYQRTCGIKFTENIRKSIELIMTSGVDYEFRTTVLPAFHSQKSIEGLAKTIGGAKRYVIQNFRNGDVLDKDLQNASSFTPEDLHQFREIARRYIKDVQVRENL